MALFLRAALAMPRFAAYDTPAPPYCRPSRARHTGAVALANQNTRSSPRSAARWSPRPATPTPRNTPSPARSPARPPLRRRPAARAALAAGPVGAGDALVPGGPPRCRSGTPPVGRLDCSRTAAYGARGRLARCAGALAGHAVPAPSAVPEQLAGTASHASHDALGGIGAAAADRRGRATSPPGSAAPADRCSHRGRRCATGSLAPTRSRSRPHRPTAPAPTSVAPTAAGVTAAASPCPAPTWPGRQWP